MTNSMSVQARQEMLVRIQEKYLPSDWKRKSQLLDGFIAATGYDRKHAIKLLNRDISKPIQNRNRGRPLRYDEVVVKVLEMLWHAGNQICSKRLALIKKSATDVVLGFNIASQRLLFKVLGIDVYYEHTNRPVTEHF